MKRPNILMLHTDEQRFDTLGANGNSIIKTPNLDKLAHEGVNFTHCFAQNPVCMPSRISMMTGQYCSSLGITQMAIKVPENTLTVQKLLKQYGYATALIGKLHYLPHANRDHRWPHPSYGFDHMELSDEPGCYEDAYRAYVRKKDPSQLDSISLGLPPASRKWQEVMGIQDGINHPKREIEIAYPFKGRSDCTHSAFVGEQTIEYLHTRQTDSIPFFCFSGFYSPHPPLVAPNEYFDLYSEDEMPIPAFSPEINAQRTEMCFSDQEIRKSTLGYYAMVSEVDHWIGRIMDALEKSGLKDTTVVVFTSDHGEWLGEHLKYGKGFWAPDVISHVPLIFLVPKALQGQSGTLCAEIVECVDIVPTLLGLAGVPQPPCIQGRVLPVAADVSAGTSDGCALTEAYGWKSFRMDKHRYVISATEGELLFDLETDPFEYNNIANKSESAVVLAEARRQLINRMLRIENPVERAWVY
jgi:arylsulfatase A-like enzyme